MIELQKQKEKEFHNKIRNEELKDSRSDYEYLTSNKKFYSITRKSWQFVNNWIFQKARDKKILDYCCGNGDFSIFLAKNGFEITGIDISETSIQNAKGKALKEGVKDKASFSVMDAENLEFENGYFDFIICNGVLHHLNVKKAYSELARVLKPDGEILCDEPLAYNPIFQLYRRKTPHLRTSWEMEHILTKNEIELTKKYFNDIDTKFFHLATLMAVPFRNLPGFDYILGFFEMIDSVLLKLPILKWLAWQIVFVLSNPRSENLTAPSKQRFANISVIIPCRNEDKFIGRCLDSIVRQDYPKENLEVLVVDGASEDRTKEIITKYSKRFPYIKPLGNPQKFTPFGLNIGIKAATGQIIIRMDSHALYQRDYISKCIKYLQEFKADNVGGVIKAIPATPTLIARAIAISLSHPFGAASSFRTGTKRPKWVDTVFGGCYKREVFEKIGLFNENLIRSQDLEFNLRLKKAGGKIILVPDIVSYYYPKSNLSDFCIHSFTDGMWAIYPLKFVKMPFRLRHYIPLIFVLTLPISIWPYIVFSLFFSAQIAMRERDLRYLFLMPTAFFCRHFGYGFGSILGLVKLLK